MNLSSDSDEIKGKKWSKQEKFGKMKDPEYFATWWNENLYTLKETARKSGDYSVQACQVEMLVGPPSEMPTIYVDMQMGARIYENNDATEFTSTNEKYFDWYRKGMEYNDDLEKEPAYGETQAEVKPPVKFPPVDLKQEPVFVDKINELEEAYNAYKAA